MTEIDDRELSQRLRALRVDPPATGFEARLAERLIATAPEPASAQRRGGRVIMGPWLRRGPVRLIGATALFLAGAAAAVEGGVVEWVQARVQAVRSPAPPPAPPAPSPFERAPAPRRERVERHPAPADAVVGVPRAPEPPARAEALEPPPTVPRLRVPERRLERAQEAASAPERRPALEPPLIPRLEIDPRGRERGSDPDTRLGRGLARPGESALARERGRDFERIRDIAKVRRERATTDNDRPRALDRLRERRDRINVERREMMQERGRRDRQSR